MSKQCKYASSKGGNDVEDLSERLAADLRHHIRTLVYDRRTLDFI